MLKAMGGGTFMHCGKHLAEATWLVSASGSISQDGPAQSSSLHTVEGDKVPVVHGKSMVWVFPASGMGKPLCGTVFTQGPGSTW